LTTTTTEKPTAVTEKPIKLGTVEDVEERFGIPARRTRDLCRADLFPHIRLGRQIRFDLDHVEAWLRSGGTRQAP
jgi:hypothetical protein